MEIGGYDEHDGVSEGSLGSSPDRLDARTGINISHKTPRLGQTNLGNIPGGNQPGSSRDTTAYMNAQRAERSAKLKSAIKGQLGKHHKPNLPEQDVAEGKPQKRADRYHINKDGKPASLSSYADRANAVKDRDAQYPGAKVHQVGPRGKVKGEFEEGMLTHRDFEKPDDVDVQKMAKMAARGLLTYAAKTKMNPANLLKKDYYALAAMLEKTNPQLYAAIDAQLSDNDYNWLYFKAAALAANTAAKQGVAEGELTAYQKLLKQMRQNAKNDPNRIPRGYELTAHGELVKKSKTEKPNDGVGGLGEGMVEGTFQDDGKMDWNAWKQKAKKHGAVKFTDTDNKTIAYDKDGKVVSSITWSQKKSGVAEAAQGHTIEAHGVRGMDRKTWHKTFKNVDQMNAWAEKYDAEVHGTRDLEQAQRGNLSPAIEGVTETTSSAGMATAPGVGKGPKTGTLFGGSYAPRTPFAGKKKANTSVIKR
jgi:hypothetical protein